MRTVACEHCGKKNRVPATGQGTPRCGNCGRPLPWIVDAGDDDFHEIAEQASPFVLVDMWAAWCGPCRMVSPALEQIAKELAGRIKLVKVDVDNAPRLSQRFDIRAVPTLMVLRDGKVLASQPGAAPVSVLRQWVENAMAEASTSST
ncbi:MAG TPA: thioredoxin [Actinopolymorphaceae bacterium]